MKKKIFSLCLIFCLLISAVLLMPACKKDNPQGGNGVVDGGNGGNIKSENEILNEQYQVIIDDIENDLKANVTIIASAGAEYSLTNITDGIKGQPKGEKAGIDGITLRCDNGNYHIVVPSEEQEMFLINGISYEKDKKGNWSASDTSEVLGVIDGSESVIKTFDFTKIMEVVRTIAGYIGEVNVNISTENEVTTLTIEVDMTQKVSALLKVLATDKEETLEKVINDAMKTLTGKEFDVMNFVKKYTDQITNDTTIGDLINLVKQETGIDIATLYSQVKSVLETIPIYNSASVKFNYLYEGGTLKLQNRRTLLELPELDEVKDMKLVDLIGDNEGEPEQTADGEEPQLGAMFYELITEYLQDPKMTLSALIGKKDQEEDSDDVFTYIEAGTLVDLSVEVKVELDSAKKLNSIEVSLNAVAQLVNEGNGAEYSAKANGRIDFVKRGTTVITCDVASVNNLSADLHMTIENVEEDIVIDLTNLPTFAKSFDAKVVIPANYNSDIEEERQDREITVGSYDKTTKKLTIKADFYNGCIENYEFNTMYITYSGEENEIKYDFRIRVVIDNLVNVEDAE